MTSSTKYLVEAGSISPETRLMIIRPKPSVISARRGRMSCKISGRALKIGVFLAGLDGVLSMMGVKFLDSSGRRLGSEADWRFPVRTVGRIIQPQEFR